MNINNTLKQELKKIETMDIHHPRYPQYRRSIMEAADIINYVVVEILKKENKDSD